MAFHESYDCDVCGKSKGSSEQWWLAWLDCYSAQNDATNQPLLKLTRWEPGLAHASEVRHLCGARCAGTMMDRWMTEQHAHPEASCETD